MVIGLIIIVSLYAYTFYQAQKQPDNSPSNFLSQEPISVNKKVVVCIGDSLTHGRVSYNYVDILAVKFGSKGYKFINAGINGELAYNVLQRLDSIITCNPDFITVLIGSNDVNASLSEENTSRAVKNMNLPKAPTDNFFKENLIRICLRLKSETKAKIALLSIPPIGEDFQHYAYKRTVHYGNIIKSVALKEKITYLPLHENMAEVLKKQNSKPKISYGKKWKFIMYREILRLHLFGRSFEEISKANGFVLLTDCLHLNQKGAKMIADLISAFIIKSGNH